MIRTFCAFRSEIVGMDEKKLLFYFILAVLLIRILFILATNSYINGAYDDFEAIANNILAGNGYSVSPGHYWSSKIEPTCMVAPLYTYFYALAKFLFNSSPTSYLFIHLVQALFSAVSLIMVFKISRTVFGQFTAFLTSTAFLLLPTYSFYVAKSNEATFTVFFCLILVHLSLSVSRQYSSKKIVVLGIVTGLGLLVNPTVSAALPVVFLYIAFIGRNEPLRVAKDIFVIVSIAAILISPWIIRNYLVFNKFIFIKSSLGQTLWIGNNRFSTGTQHPFFIPIEKFYYNPEIRKAYPFLDKIESLREIQRQELFKNEAIDFIKNNPSKAFLLMLKKTFFFWIYDKYKIQRFKDSGEVVLWKLYSIINIILIGLFVSSLPILVRRKELDIHKIFIILFCLSISSIHIITSVGMIRFRLPVDPFIQMFSMYTVSFLIERE